MDRAPRSPRKTPARPAKPRAAEPLGAPRDPLHDKLLALALALPGAEEDWPWGSIHCKVGGKIFVGWSRDADGVMRLGLRTSPALQAMLVASDPRFSIAKYTGKYGGIDMRLGPRPDWAEVEQLIVESFRIVAPKAVVKVLDAARTEPSAPAKGALSKRPSAKKTAKAAAKTPSPKRPAAKAPAAARTRTGGSKKTT